MPSWSRREFGRVCTAGATSALVSTRVAAQQQTSVVNLQIVGLCATHKETDTNGYIGLINPEYFRHLHLDEHIAEFAIASDAIASVTGDKGTEAKGDYVKRWREDEVKTFTRWSLFHRRLEIETSGNASLEDKIKKAAKLRDALVAADYEAALKPKWYSNRHVVSGAVTLRGGTLDDGKGREKNYGWEFHKTVWKYQPFVAPNPVQQNDLNDCVTYRRSQVTALTVYELTGSVPVATILLKPGSEAEGYVANLVQELAPTSAAPGKVHHVVAYYSVYQSFERDMSPQALSDLPIPVGKPKKKELIVTNGDVYCPSGTP